MYKYTENIKRSEYIIKLEYFKLETTNFVSLDIFTAIF